MNELLGSRIKESRYATFYPCSALVATSNFYFTPTNYLENSKYLFNGEGTKNDITLSALLVVNYKRYIDKN